MTMKKFSTLKNKWLKDPEVKSAYNASVLEFAVAQKMLSARLKAKLTQQTTRHYKHHKQKANKIMAQEKHTQIQTSNKNEQSNNRNKKHQAHARKQIQQQKQKENNKAIT